MKQFVVVALAIALVAGILMWLSSNGTEAPSSDENLVTEQNETMEEEKTLPKIAPINHASLVLTWDDLVVYVDPVDAEAFAGQPEPDVILVTDIHGDHYSAEALEALVGEAALIVPQVVADELPETIRGGARVMVNGQMVRNPELGIELLAFPMYNLPEQNLETVYHEEGRGNGYIIEKSNARVYIAGDTAGIPEMRALENIDVAFIPMNLPYTMTIEEAADAVLDFAPKQVYPYHYRGTEGLSDVDSFKQMVEEANPEIEVVLLDWYAE